MAAELPARAAVIVGVDHYDDAEIRDLACAENDCIQLQGFLQHAAGFGRVELLYGQRATSQAVLDTAGEVVGALGPGDLFCFYFAGHGVEHNGRHLLLCPGVRYARLRYGLQTVPVDLVREETDRPGVNRVFILDACRSDLLSTRAVGTAGMRGEQALRDVVVRAKADAAAREADPGSMAVLCSCAEGQQAGEIAGQRHGLFTAALLGVLHDAIDEGAELGVSDAMEAALARRMRDLAGRHGLHSSQRPWILRSGPPPVLIYGRGETPAVEAPAVEAPVAKAPPKNSPPPAPPPPPPVPLPAPPTRRRRPAAPKADGKHPPRPKKVAPSRRRQAEPQPHAFGTSLRMRVFADADACAAAIQRDGNPGAYVHKQARARRDEWREAAGMGVPQGQWLWGLCLLLGEQTGRDVRKAAACFRSAAERGYAPAQCSYGFCCYEGKGVPQSAAEAVQWFRKAAEKADPRGQWCLGACYDAGEGVPQDKAAAAEWYRKAAEQGNATAQYNLGKAYDDGDGVPKDFGKAVAWYRKAADQGHGDAQNNLGMNYYLGEGVRQDYAEALKWFRKAVAQGNAKGQYNLGVCYHYGRGIAKDPVEALKWYRLAAEQGDPHAQNNLGVCYGKGEGVGQDHAESVKWYRLAAEQGHVTAQYNLGDHYLHGQGVGQDKKQAALWFQKAAAQGHADAQKALKGLEGGCFISTATAQFLGWADQGPQMTLLRRLRDTYMQQTPARRAEVGAYYRLAPIIVRRGAAGGDARRIWSSVAERYILPVVDLAEAGDAAGAHAVYREMVDRLARRYLTPAERAAARLGNVPTPPARAG